MTPLFLKPLELPRRDEIAANFAAENGDGAGENSVRAILCRSDGRFIVTGGTDRKLRYWDLDSCRSSYVVNGLYDDELKPRYRYVVIGVVS
jgi:phosphoinositide-3-kinase regulatory subunit 4